MPTAPTTTFTGTQLVPFYPQDARLQNVKLPVSVSYVKGQVLGELWGANAVYTVSLGAPTAGTFTLTVGGNTTAGIAYNATAAAVQTALTGLASVGANNATVTGNAGGPYTVTFQNALGAQAVTLTGSGTGLTGGTFAITTTTAGSAGQPGTFKAYASGNTDGSQTPRAILAYDASTDASGNITWGAAAGSSEWNATQPYVPAYFQGTFATGDLTGLDATALTNQPPWHLISGTVTNGILVLP